MKFRNNIISFILGMLVMLPMGGYAANLIVKDVDIPILVDGKQIDTQVYNINDKNYTSVRDVAEAMGGIVEYKNKTVYISTAKPGTVQDVAKQADNCVLISMMKDTTQKATASGVLWGTDYILTNKHVVEQYGVNKWIAEGNKSDIDNYYCTEFKTFETDLDIALIRTDRPHGGNIKIGDSDKVKVGDEVVVISSPRGTKNVVASGKVTKVEKFNGSTFFITDAPISNGSSGGGLFNMKGEFIGLLYGGFDDNERLAYAMAVNDIQKIIQ